MGEIMNDDKLSIADLQELQPYGDHDVHAMSVARARSKGPSPWDLNPWVWEYTFRKEG